MPAPAVATQGLDSILDDISDILETDALTFVQSYSQTGGQ
jgi:ubiquitin-like protein Pup